MSEWVDNQKVPTSNFRKLLQERIESPNPRRELTAEEAKRLARLEAIADKLRLGENVQNLWSCIVFPFHQVKQGCPWVAVVLR